MHAGFKADRGDIDTDQPIADKGDDTDVILEQAAAQGMNALAAWLITTAGHVQLRKYRKHPRGLKKTPVSRTHDPRRPYLSVARLLAQRQ